MCQDRFNPRRSRLFDALSEPQLLPLRRVARQISVPRRQRIYSAGDASDRVLLLEAGIVKVIAPLPPDPDVLLAFLYPGDVFGESAIIDDGPRDHATEAHEDSRAWSIDRDVVLDLLGHSPALGFAFLRLFAGGARRFRTRVEELLQKDAHGRVVRTLLNLSVQHSVADADGLLIPHRLTQADLANMAGLARETVNVVLRDLRARGLVDMTRDSIRLRRPAALRAARSTTSPIRQEAHHDDDCHRVHPFGGPAAPGADACRVDRDAGHAFDGGTGRAALGARAHRV